MIKLIQILGIRVCVCVCVCVRARACMCAHACMSVSVCLCPDMHLKKHPLVLPCHFICLQLTAAKLWD